MESLFRLVRLPMLPIPILLWTLAWALVLAVVTVALPFLILLTTVFRAVGLPFVFFYAAFNNQASALRDYLKNWKGSYVKNLKLYQSVPISRIYQEVFEWGRAPQGRGTTGWIVVSNIAVVLVAGSFFSKEVLEITVFLALVLIALAIWSNS